MANLIHYLMIIKGSIARIQFRIFCNLLMIFVSIFIFAEASAKEKLTCDPIDAPHIDPESIISSIEKRISALHELQAGLRQARDELKTASTKEEWGNAGVLLSATVKHTTAVALTVTGVLAGAPGVLAAEAGLKALAVSITAATSSFVIDAIHANPNDILKGPLSTYAISQVGLLGENILKGLRREALARAWSATAGIGTFVKETFDFVNLAELHGSANLHTQVKSFNKQIAKYEKDISILKEELGRIKKLVSETTQKINTEFVHIIAKHNKSDEPMCKKDTDLADKRKQYQEKMDDLRKKVDSGNFGVGNNAREAVNQQIGQYEKTLDHYYERGKASATSTNTASSSALSATAIQASGMVIQQMQRHVMENMAVQQNGRSQNYYGGNSSSSAGATSNYVCVEWRTVRHHCEVAGDTNCGQLVQECTRTESR